MKKQIILTLIVAIATSMTVNAQNVALHTNGTTQHFDGPNGLIAAYNESVSGDTIYLSGGSFTPPANFEKTLSIYGAGHYVDSTMVTGKTFINGNINFKENADNFLIEGAHITGWVRFDNNISINNVTFKSSIFNGEVNVQGDNTNPSKSGSFIRCVFQGELKLNNATNFYFSNSIFSEQYISNSTNNLFENNIMLVTINTSANTNYLFRNGHNNTIRNNCIISTGNYSDRASSNIGDKFYNNLFTHANPYFGTNPVSVNNYTGVAQADIFEDQTGVYFNYAHDYHLKNTEAYLGTDGTQVGIYGGVFPYKEGAVPSNPHFQIEEIAPTAAEGKLNVKLKVSAQDN